MSPREAETAVESNWHTETCVCNTQSRKAIINTLTIEAMISTQPTHLLIQKGLKGTSPLRIRPHSNFYLCDKKKRTETVPSVTSISRLAGSMFSLQRQDLLFLALRMVGHISAPLKYFGALFSRNCSSLPIQFLIPQRVVGLEVIYPSLTLK